jgi:prevent-host-death family protein
MSPIGGWIARGAAMKEISIREAKDKLTSLIREIEKGQPVRLTRRGKPVAVLISNQDYERMKATLEPRPDFMRFLQGWRREMIAKGIPFLSDQELADL